MAVIRPKQKHTDRVIIIIIRRICNPQYIEQNTEGNVHGISVSKLHALF